MGLDEVVLVVVDVSLLEAGVGAVVVVVEVDDELELPPAGEGFTIVVLFSVFFSAGAAGVTVSVFCSHAVKSAAPARIQSSFFIISWIAHVGTLGIRTHT